MIDVYVLSDHSCYLYSTVDAFINMLKEVKAKVPEEYREKLHIEFSVDYDNNAVVDVYYQRPETEKELEAKRDEIRMNELKWLKQLKEKYPNV